MYCNKCGKEVADKDEFCSRCGNRVRHIIKEDQDSFVKPGDEVKEELLFESLGFPQKRKKLMNVCTVIMLVLGVILLFLSVLVYGELRQLCILIGIAAVILSVIMIFYNKSSESKHVRFAIYSGHIEGTVVGSEKEISVPYSEIFEVQKAEVLSNELLMIETRETTYTFFTNYLDQAYQILNQKLSSLEAGLKEGRPILQCRECGHEISRSTENCPHCGAKTRYGNEVKKREVLKRDLYIVTGMMIIGFIVLPKSTIIGFSLIVGGIVGIISWVKNGNS